MVRARVAILNNCARSLLSSYYSSNLTFVDKPSEQLDGALMHFQKHSSYLCEAFHIMSTSPPPRPDSTDWGSALYYKLWRRLLISSIPPFSVLPWCFTEGRSCRSDKPLPDPFEPDGKGGGGLEGRELEKVLGKIFVLHLHNQWKKPFPEGGWVDRLLLKKYTEDLPPSSPSDP